MRRLRHVHDGLSYQEVRIPTAAMHRFGKCLTLLTQLSGKWQDCNAGRRCTVAGAHADISKILRDVHGI